MPLNYGSVMSKCLTLIERAGMKSPDMLLLSDENSLWGADMYIEVEGDVPDAKMISLSGTYICKVFEGPYQNIGKWVTEMKTYLTERGKVATKILYYYTTCPKCAKEYGENSVSIHMKQKS